MGIHMFRMPIDERQHAIDRWGARKSSRAPGTYSAAVRNDRREVNGCEHQRDCGDSPSDLLQ